MAQFTVTSVPSRVADALAIPAAKRTAPGRAVIWIGTLENAGPTAIFLRRSVAAPNPALVVGARLTRAARRRLVEYTEATYGGSLVGLDGARDGPRGHPGRTGRDDMNVLLSGPAGAGKSQIARQMLRDNPDLRAVADFTAIYAALSLVERGPDGRYPVRHAHDDLLPLTEYVRRAVITGAVQRGLGLIVTNSGWRDRPPAIPLVADGRGRVRADRGSGRGHREGPPR